MRASSEIAPPWTERCDTVFPASATISWPLGESRDAHLPLTNCQAGSGGRHPLDSSVFGAEPGATQHAVARLAHEPLFRRSATANAAFNTSSAASRSVP